jgi:hypothetical protein
VLKYVGYAIVAIVAGTFALLNLAAMLNAPLCWLLGGGTFCAGV